MKKSISAFLFLAGLLWAGLPAQSFAASPRSDWARGLRLEEPAAGASLIAVVRLVSIENIPFTSGGKMQMEVKQYKFKPLKIVKGVYAREELSMMSGDLGGYNFGEQMKQVKEGQIFLLFLGRSETGYRNSNGDVSSLRHSMPMLKDENDPLVETVKALLALQAEPDEIKRVRTLLDQLAKRPVAGIDAIPLLEALKTRALIAAQLPETGKMLAKYIEADDLAVSISAAETAKSVLEANYLKSGTLQKELGRSVFAQLGKNMPNVDARKALFGALGAIGNANAPEVAELFEAPSETLGEQQARIEAMGDIGSGVAYGKIVTEYLQKMPLDAEYGLQRACEEALCQIAPEQAGKELIARIQRKAAAGLDVTVEIEAMAKLPPAQTATLLGQVAEELGAWKFGEKRPFGEAAGSSERKGFAESCLKVTEKTAGTKPPVGENLVATLAQLLAPDDTGRWAAIPALMKIDTDAAAKALQPYLKGEANLQSKLTMAEFLGKHGMKDGYPYAIEHMSDTWLLEQAVAALKAIKEPKAAEQLKQILATSNDVMWNRAAIRAMGATGMKDQTENFLKITGDWKNPLAPAALIALGDLGEVKALPKAQEALGSRNSDIVNAGVNSAAKLLAALEGGEAKHPETKELRDQVAALLSASDTPETSRAAALDALEALNDPRLEKALGEVLKDAKLEKSSLRPRVEKLAAERKIKVE